MDRFVRQLMSLPSMDAAEERCLARLARQGDRDARATLITAGLRSVALRACMLGLTGDDLRDAVQSGAIGLIRAVDRFDPDRGARLATYAWWWIGAEMGVSRRPETSIEGIEPGVEESCVPGDDLLEGLPDDAAEVVRLRFGLGPHERPPMSRAAVARQLGIGEARVRTIEGKAMRQLRGRLAKVGDRAPRQREADPP